MISKRKIWEGLVFVGLLALSAALVLWSRGPALAGQLPPLTPQGEDRLLQPALSANPTQYEWGRYLYWLNCMACHGDRGQGLTAEFRSLYVEDQNCWAHGCHGGRAEDQGYPLPPTVPAIISASGGLFPFATPGALFEYLRTTQPPQHPGYLPEDQYWAITAYLLVQNNRLSPGQVLGPGAQTSDARDYWRFAAAEGLVLLTAGFVAWLLWRRKPGKPGQA